MLEEAIVKVDHLSHRYSVQWAIRDIHFEIHRNGVYGLLGSNGAGKSTTMNIICGVLKQTSGDVVINGISIRENPKQAKRYIGFLPQKPPLYGELTVEEYLTYCAHLHGVAAKGVKPAVAEVMDKCGIAHFRRRLISNLSGGYQQRVGVAQALIHKPRLVVLDEPTNGLDPNQILEIRHLIREIAEERTVILSTHILPEVQASCDYIWMIEQGSLVFSGTVDEFDSYILPSSVYVSLINKPTIEELKTLQGVVEVEELGGTKYRLRFADAPEAMERVVQASFQHNWRLNEIYLEKNSLDSIFAELSKKKN